MLRPQFTLRALLVAMLVVGAFFGGTKWSSLAPKWGEPSYRDIGHGWLEVRWWTGRTEVVGFSGGSIFNRGAPDEYTTGFEY